MELSEQSKIRWRCRRGMLELDLFLIPFFDRCFQNLSKEEQTTFIQMLKEPDPNLFNWLMKKEAVDSRPYRSLIEKIIQFKSYRA